MANQDLFDAEYPGYLRPIAPHLSTRYAFVTEIASGKNGTTYKIKDRESDHFYCLKTISSAVQAQDDRDRVRRTLRKEVEILRPLNHRCLPEIYVSNVDAELPYYVCTFHPGVTWEKFRTQRSKLNLDESIFVILSLIDTLQYLHDHGRTHCDLHQDNLLISEHVLAEGIMIIDFGSGHRASADDPITPDRGHAGFKNGRALARHRRNVRRQDAADDFKSYDFAALGTSLLQMEQVFFGNSSHDQLVAYREFCAMLRDGRVRHWRDVRERFDEVVDPAALVSRLDYLFMMPDGSRRSITLPGNRPVRVGEGVLAIVECPIFQRLRGIRQLSFCD